MTQEFITPRARAGKFAFLIAFRRVCDKVIGHNYLRDVRKKINVVTGKGVL